MEIEWQNVRKVLIVKLRSIGDTVLSTPSLIALRKFLPDVQIDILLEDWVAPVLDGFDEVDNIIVVSKGTKDRISLARKIRKEKYDVAFNLHGGTTATFFVRASGAKHRVGYAEYQYSFLYNHRLSSAADFWGKKHTHSAEQQLALLGSVGIPVGDSVKTKLSTTETSMLSLSEKVSEKTKKLGNDWIKLVENSSTEYCLIHPAAAFDTKQWATEKFATVVDFLAEKRIKAVAVATKKERKVLDELALFSTAPVLTLDDLTLPEITALASKARLFIGNDSGIAHMAAAVKTPSIVIFGSSNRNHWHPWTDAPYEIAYEEMPCQPCAGYVCEEFDEPKCILSVGSEKVIESIEKLL